MMVTDDAANLPAPSRNVVRRTGVMPAVRGSDAYVMYRFLAPHSP